MYEVKVPELVLTSKVNLQIEEKGVVELDWSDYDILDKYFVIYRKQEGEEEWKTLVSLEEKFNGGHFIDSLGNDRNVPNEPKINVGRNDSENSIQVDVMASDNGTTYSYYIEAYDINSMKLLNRSNVIID